jgi:hypothetical protein
VPKKGIFMSNKWSHLAALVCLSSIELAALMPSAATAYADPTPLAEPVPCNTQDEPGQTFAGKFDPPQGGHRHGDSVVSAQFYMYCSQSVVVNVVYTLHEYPPSGADVIKGSGHLNLNITCNTTSAPCIVGPFDTDKISVGGALTGSRTFAIAGTASVYPKGTVLLPDGTALGQPVIEISNLISNSAKL